MMLNPYKPPKTERGTSERRDDRKGNSDYAPLPLYFLGIIIGLGPTVVGAAWVGRFFILHRILGMSVSRSHHWLILTTLGILLLSTFGLLTFVSARGIVRRFKRGAT
jgi:hypothetical protein